MMKKYIFLMGVIFILLNLSSCKLFEDGFATIDQQVDEKQQIIIKALTDCDEKMLKSVLSENALNSSDLDDGIDYIFELFDGNIINIEKSGCPVSDYFDSGKHSKQVQANYVITTDSNRVYELYFELWIKQEIMPEKLGVDKIKLCDEEVDAPNYVPAYKHKNSGIYNPNWDTEYYASLEESEN